MGENNLYCKTFITQEMLKKNILATNAIYVSTEHKKKYIKEYLYNIEKVLKKISTISSDKQLKKLIKGPICQSDFRSIFK